MKIIEQCVKIQFTEDELETITRAFSIFSELDDTISLLADNNKEWEIDIPDDEYDMIRDIRKYLNNCF